MTIEVAIQLRVGILDELYEIAERCPSSRWRWLARRHAHHRFEIYRNFLKEVEEHLQVLFDLHENARMLETIDADG